MNVMADSINTISCAIGKIAVSSEQQSQVFRRPREPLVKRITQQNNKITEQSTSRVSTQQELTEQLNHEVDLFRLQDEAPSYTEP